MIDVQIVRAPWWSGKGYYLRRRRDSVQVTKNELTTQVAFAEAAHAAYLSRGTGPNGLPPAAEAVKRRMEGQRIVDERVRDLSRRLLEEALAGLSLPVPVSYLGYSTRTRPSPGP